MCFQTCKKYYKYVFLIMKKKFNNIFFKIHNFLNVLNVYKYFNIIKLWGTSPSYFLSWFMKVK